MSQKLSNGPIGLALVIIAVGIGWLLSALGIGPGVNWIWSLGLGVIGIATFIVSGGLDKVSIIVGPFFLVASVLSVLRQRQSLPLDIEAPVLVILVGILLLAAQHSAIPLPNWFVPSDANKP